MANKENSPELAPSGSVPATGSVTRHSIYNLIGVVVPLFLSLVTIPFFLKAIGEVRYGVVALIWLLFGYFGLFDLGLSKATANQLSRSENKTPERRRRLFTTALVANVGMGVFAGILFLALCYLLIPFLNSMSIELKMEMHATIPYVAALVVISITNAVLVGTLESFGKFLQLNLLGIFGAVFTQLLPLFAVWYIGPNIDVIVGATVVGRLLTFLPLVFMALTCIGRIAVRDFDRVLLKDLFSYGGWVTLSNIISPLLVSADQFIIGAMLGARSVSHYSIPFNLATKVLIIPGAITRALFPQLSNATYDEARRRGELTAQAIAYLLAMVCVPCIFLANTGLDLWLGKDFAAEASTVCRIIFLGTWINGVAFVPYVFLQGQGRPDLVAKFHLFEVLPYIVLLFLSIHYFGLAGAAIAWCARVSVDAVLLLRASGFSFGRMSTMVGLSVALIAAVCVSQFGALSIGAASAWVVGMTAVIAFLSVKNNAIIRRLAMAAVPRAWSRVV